MATVPAINIPVHVHLSEEGVDNLIATLVDAQRDLEDALAIIKADLKGLREQKDIRLGRGHRETLVLSESSPWKSYIVSLDGTELMGTFKCTCPAFEFKHGVNKEGNCKHIVKVIHERRFSK